LRFISLKESELSDEGWQAKVHIYDSYAKEDVYFCLSTLV